MWCDDSVTDRGGPELDGWLVRPPGESAHPPVGFVGVSSPRLAAEQEVVA